jgi:uncharacterized phage protein gp47/JayE
MALELVNAYIGLDVLLEESFASTADRDYLILRAAERGLEPKAATAARVKAKIDGDVSLGDRFSCDGVIYAVTEELGGGYYALDCEETGTGGNTHFGTMLPLNLSGIKSAELVQVLIYGEDEEDTEAFRTRYFESISEKGFGGNRADYRKWVKALDGVGQVKCIRSPSGGGTVGIVITDSENGEASEELLKSVKAYLDPIDKEGLGEGIAPIGHIVDVSSVVPRAVTISLDWVLADGTDEAAAYTKAMELIKSYISEVNSGWEDADGLTLNSYQTLIRLSEMSEITDIVSIKYSGCESISADWNEIFEFSSLVVEAES